MLPDKVLRLRVRTDLVDPRFLVQALRLPEVRAEFEANATGTSDSMRNLSQPKIEAAPVLLPPLNEQRRIVAKLEALQARSRRAREALDAVPPLLERLRQSLLAAAFRGDLTADWRERNSNAESVEALLTRVPPPEGKSSGRAATSSTRVGRAALAVGNPGTKTPPGWKWVPLARVARMESGHTPSRNHSDYWDGDIPWIGIRDAREHHGREIATTFQTVTEKGLANSASRLLPARTVCLSRTASVGYVTIMQRSMATSQDFANWVCSDALLPEFLMYALLAEGDHLRTFGEGSTHTTIYFPELKALHISLPPLAEQTQIVTVVQKYLSRLDRLQVQAAGYEDRLAQLDRSTLAKAFRGELVPQDPNDVPADFTLSRAATTSAEAPRQRARRAKAAE